MEPPNHVGKPGSKLGLDLELVQHLQEVRKAVHRCSERWRLNLAYKALERAARLEQSCFAQSALKAGAQQSAEVCLHLHIHPQSELRSHGTAIKLRYQLYVGPFRTGHSETAAYASATIRGRTANLGCKAYAMEAVSLTD